MNRELRSRRRRTNRLWPWVVVVTAVVVQSVAHLTNELALDGRYRWLNAAADGSVFGRADTAAIALCAALAGVAAYGGRRTVHRALLCACLLLVMFDDATGIHDRLRDTPRAGDVALGVAVVCVLGLTLVLLCAEAARATVAPRQLLAVGLVALVAAVAVRVIAAVSGVGATLHTAERALGVVGEQGLDFGGWLLVACGLLGVLVAESQSNGGNVGADALQLTREASSWQHRREDSSARPTR